MVQAKRQLSLAIHHYPAADFHKTEEHISETSEIEDGSETLGSEDDSDIDERSKKCAWNRSSIF